MIIDAHNHPDWHGHDLDRFLVNMDQHGIAKTWLLSWECPPDEYDPVHYGLLSPAGSSGSPLPFDRCLSYVERQPDRFVLGYCPDIRRPDALDRMKAAVDIHGARVCGELKLRMMYDNPDALRFFRFCGERGLPVTLHLDYEFSTGVTYPRPSYWYGGGIEALERALKACPDTIFLGHAPGFWAHISGDDRFDKEPYPSGPVLPGGKVPELLRKYPKLYGDLSAGSGANALRRDLDNARSFILEFSDRLLYGRDYFDNALQELLGSLDLPAEVLEKLFSGNALRLVPLT